MRFVSVFLSVLPFFLISFPTAASGQDEAGFRLRKIVLDAGHGGRDGGTTPAGVREKEIVLDIALRVGALLNRQFPDLEVIYTRRTDVFVELAERAAIANRAKADLFVSIHADAVESTSPNGSSSWVMGVAREEANLELAMRENSVITYEENYQTRYENFDPADPVSYLKFALVQAAYLDQSIDLAALMQEHYQKNTTISTSRGVKQNIYLVLHRTTMPAVLTEIGFLSNASDRRYITSEAGKNAIARSIADAIGEYKNKVEENSRTVVADASGAGQPLAVAPSAEPADSPRATADPAVVFRVQVSASPSRVNPSNRGRFGEYAGRLEMRRIGNYYKYFFGETNSYSEALSLQRTVRRQFRDAFIVAFRGDEPVELTEEMKLN